jgi:hypothetical protein
MTATECWKDIPGYEEFYQASNLGRIRSKDRVVVQKSPYGSLMERHLRGQLLRLQTCSNGYLFVQLGKYNIQLVHRLVAMTFIEGDFSLQVNHKNGIRTDNHVSNLEWVTCSENHLHSYRELPRKKHGLTRQVLLVGSQQVIRFDSGLSASKYLHVRPGSVSSAALKGHRCRGWSVIYAT